MNYKNLFVGIDIGGTKISIVFFKKNKIIKKIKLITDTIYGPKNVKIIVQSLLIYKKNIKKMENKLVRSIPERNNGPRSI